MIDSVHFSNNAALIAQVAEFYIKDGARVADVTYGRGAFWRKTDISRFDFRPTDLMPNLDVDPPHAKKADFRRLPYSNASLHLVVFDPPYMANAGAHSQVENEYRNFATTRAMSHDEILNIYTQGMAEAKTVLIPNGMLWVKCKDKIVGKKQRWSFIEIKDIAEKQLGFYAKDQYIVVPTSRTYHQRMQPIHHACKIHSYLWIFVKL
jgi:hypothetical protein